MHIKDFCCCVCVGLRYVCIGTGGLKNTNYTIPRNKREKPLDTSVHDGSLHKLMIIQ